MSSSGIQSISSGPLIIRTYNDSTSSDVTYLLKDYDYPVSSNYVLITSTNGQLVPSDNIYISSITISSINGLPYTPGSGGSVSSISSGTNISITGTSSNPIINVDINSTLLMNGFPIYDNNTITIAAGSIINLSTLSTSIVLDQASQSVTITSVPTTTIRGFTGTDDGILRVNGYVALYGSTTQLQINDTNGSIKGSLSYSYTDDDIHLNAIQLLDLSGNQGLALTSQNGQRIRFNTNGGGNLDADIEGSITLTAGYSTSTGNINLNTASTSIVLDQASQSIILTANNGININASTLFNGSIKVASTFYDNSNLSGTAGQVLTAGTGGQVIWSTISGSVGGDVFWASTLSGDIVNTNTGIVNISTALIVNNSFSTLTIFDNIGLPGTTGQVLTAGPSGAQVIWSNTLNVLSISTTSISTTSISTSTINGLPYPPQNDTFWTSTLSGDIINTNTGNVNISTALNVNGSILSNTSYTLYNSTSAYGTLSITPSTSAGFAGNGYINCDFLTFRTANSGGAFLSLNTNTSMMNVQGTLSTLSIRDNNGSTGTSGYVLTAGTGGQVIWNIPAVSNYPYIWQYYKGIDQTLNSDANQAGTFITWNGVIYEEPGYPSPLTNLSTTYSAPLNGWYQITFVGTLCGAVSGSMGDVPQGGTNPNLPLGAVSQFMYGIRYNLAIVPGWQGYLNGYVVGEKCGDQTQLVVIKYLSTNDTILVDNETPVGAPNGNFAALASTTLTITYLRP